jgi:predicted nucleotide-binding protein (sugar kinase/HSP70/actin superfamily)
MPRRVAFPSLGVLSLVAEHYLEALGVPVVETPPITRRTLDIGVRGTPEGLCIPCKLLFGNYVEAAECGATDIIMLGGPGTCRLGYSAALQAQRLQSMGFPIRAHTWDLRRQQQDLVRLTRTLTEGRPLHELVEPVRFLLGLLDLMDAVEAAAFWVRPRERTRGATEEAWTAVTARTVALRDRGQLEAEREAILRIMLRVERAPDRPVLRIGLVGDAYTILCTFLNHNLEVQLGRMGVEVQRWFRLGGRINLPLPFVLRRDRVAQARRAGSRFLERDVGGFARSSVGEAALMAEGEVDGLIHVTPFNCTPEVVAQSALVALQREQGVPVLTLSFDEQTGRAGVLTRLEAFVDLLGAARGRPASQWRR